MAKEKAPPDSEEAAADEGMSSARSILERVTGEKLAKSLDSGPREEGRRRARREPFSDAICFGQQWSQSGSAGENQAVTRSKIQQTTIVNVIVDMPELLTQIPQRVFEINR